MKTNTQSKTETKAQSKSESKSEMRIGGASRLVAGLAVVAASCGSAIAQGSECALAPKWKSGAETWYEFVLENTQTNSTVGEGPMAAMVAGPTLTTTQRINLSAKVIQESKGPVGGAVLAIQYQRVRVRIALGEHEVEVDTEQDKSKDGDSELGENCRATLGRTYQLQFDEGGKLVKIDGNQLTQGNAPTAQSLIGDEVFRVHMAAMYGLPGAPKSARAGEKWGGQMRQSAGHLGTFVTELSSTLTGVKDGMGSVAIVGTPSIVSAVGPMAMKAELNKGTMTAEAAWDGVAGGLKSWRSVREMSYSVSSLQDESGRARSQVDQKLTVSIERGGMGGETPKSKGGAGSESVQSPNKDG